MFFAEYLKNIAIIPIRFGKGKQGGVAWIEAIPYG
jgi:hypothetical protein